MANLGIGTLARLPLLPALAFLLLLLVIPVGQLLGLSLFDAAGRLTFDHYAKLFASRVYMDVLLITVKISLIATVAAVVLAYPVAFVIATSDRKAKTRLYFLVLIPFWTSFLVRAFAWMVLLGRNGALNKWAQGLGLIDAPLPLIYNLFGALVGTTHAMLPMAVLVMVSVMETIDANLSKAALTMGAGRGSAFWRVFFPLSLPGVAAAGLLIFLTALGFFITPTLLGGRGEIVITQVIIEQIQEQLNWPFGGAISVLLLVAAGVVFWLYDKVAGVSALGAAAAARSGTPPSGIATRMSGWSIAVLGALGRATDRLLALFGAEAPVLESTQTGRRKIGLGWKLGCAAVLFLMCAPIFIMVPISFTAQQVLDWPPQGFSLEWYRLFFESPQWMSATVFSFTVGLATAALTMALATPAAFVLVRQTVIGRKIVTALILSPMVVPRIIIAIALFYLYSKVGLVGSWTGLVLGHAVLALPYALMGVMTVLRTYDERLDHAAAVMGASRAQSFFRITLPLIRFGALSAFLLAFITSFDDLTVSLFITGGLTTTLPKQMWEDATLQVSPVLAAVSTLIIVFMLAAVLLLEWLRHRGELAVRESAEA